ncbi:MAG: hypothetical protein Kow00114_30290 [Kiloniellaceae bacterium]
MPPDRPAVLEMRAMVALAKPCSWIDVMVAAISCRRRRSSIPILGIAGAASVAGVMGKRRAGGADARRRVVFYFD